MVKKYIVLPVFALLLAESNLALAQRFAFKISLQSDTLVIGEPLIVKRKLINLTKTVQKYRLPELGLDVEGGRTKVFLQIPTGKEYYLSFSRKVLLSSPTRFDTIAPKDTVYGISTVWWGNFWDENGNRIPIEDLPSGKYKLKIVSEIPERWIPSHTEGVLIGKGKIPLISEITFWCIKPTEEDLRVLRELRKIEIEVFDYTGLQVSISRIRDIFKRAAESKSVFGKYAQYWYSLWAPTEQSIPLLEKFIAQYPDFPLTEEASFAIAFRYNRLGEKSKAKEMLLKAIQKYPKYILRNSDLAREVLGIPLPKHWYEK